MYEGNHKFIIIMLMTAVIFCGIVGVVSGADTATQIFSKQFDQAIVDTDTDEGGNFIVAGLLNGSLVAFNQGGTILWSYPTNGSIVKVITDSVGDTVWLNNVNESGYIQSNGVVLSYNKTIYNKTDISISRNGDYYAISQLSPARLTIFSKYGTETGFNVSSGSYNWTSILLDPKSEFLVSHDGVKAKQNLSLWNLSAYYGWDQFNPTHTINASLYHIDSFPYRRNISIASYTNYTNIIFFNTTNTTDIQKINQSYYEYNALNTGKYFYISTPNNITDRQSEYVNYSYFNPSTNLYNIVFKPNWKNFTIYYGNLTYDGSYFPSSAGSAVYTSSSSWTVPAFITSVSYAAYGAGGGGGYGYIVSYGGFSGTQGSAGSSTSGSVAVSPGSSIGITVGAGGAGGSTAPAAGTNGGASGIAGGSSAAGGTYAAGGTINGHIDTVVRAGYGSDPLGCGASTPPGYGYGGGGGGGTGTGSCSGTGAYTAGGAGAPGYVSISWAAAAIDYGKKPTVTIFTTQEIRNYSSQLTYVNYTTYGDNIVKMSIPEAGEKMAVATDNELIYQDVSKYNFGAYDLASHHGSLFTGFPTPPVDLAASDQLSYTIVAAGSEFNIFDSLVALVGQYPTGGVMNSVDIGQINALWAIAGGNDGKVYIQSKDVSANWYIYYQGDSAAKINTVAMSWRGEIGCVGRSDGKFECYDTRASVAIPSDFKIYVYKNGKQYSIPITISYSAAGYPYTWKPLTLTQNITDSNGILSVNNAYLGYYYNIVVGNNETSRIYQSSETTLDVIIDINTLKQNLSFSMAADFNKTYPGNMTISYTDMVVPSYVKVQISEAETGKIVYTNSFTTNNNIQMVYNGNPSIDYKVQWIYERNGVVGINQKVVGQNPSIVIPGDEIFKQAVFSILFLIICGLFTYQTRTIGMFICAFIYAAFVFIGFLPLTLTNIVALMAILAVAAVFGESKDRGI